MIGIDTLDRLLTGFVVTFVLCLAGWFGLKHYGNEHYKMGYDAAVDAGKIQHDKDVIDASKRESDLRQTLAEKDKEANQKEQEYAQALSDAQRRVLTHVDRLRCPATRTVQPNAASTDRPATAESTTDGSGSDLVPEAAADILGYGSAIASLVRRYDELTDRFEAYRALNAK